MIGFSNRQATAPSDSLEPGGLTLTQQFKRHCLHWWLIYVIALVVLAIIIVFPIPRVFVTSSTQFARLDAWKGKFCLDPSCPHPFGEIDIPGSDANNDTWIQTSQEVQITNMTGFNKYTRLALGSESYNFYLMGSGKLRNGAWPTTTVQYNKNVTMKGLNALKGFNVTSFNIFPPLPDGTNTNGTISISNPSISRYELGDLALNMSVDGVLIGITFLSNVFLGANELPLPFTAITNATAVVGLVTQQYKNGVLPIHIVASSVVYQGEHIPWYEQALGALSLRVDLNILPALQESGLARALGLGNQSSMACLL